MWRWLKLSWKRRARKLADLGIQRAQFEHAIAVLTGKPPSDLSITAVPNQSPPPASQINIPSALLERRPDIAAAERQVAAANEQIGIAKAAFYPSLTLSAGGGSQPRLYSICSHGRPASGRWVRNWPKLSSMPASATLKSKRRKLLMMSPWRNTGRRC